MSLREVTSENLDAVLALSVAPEQQTYVASNAKSIAQAHFLTSCLPGPATPEPFYTACGFRRTGRVEDGEIELVREL